MIAFRALLLCGLAAHVFQLHASTFVVTNLSDSGSGTLRQAITDANAAGGNQAVLISTSGAIVLLSALPTVSANISLLGPGRSLLTISPGLTNPASVFTMGLGTTSSITGITIQGATASGIVNLGTLSMKDCLFANNSGMAGGAISNAGTVYLSACTLFNNTATQIGGAIYNSGTLWITGSSLQNNAVRCPPPALSQPGYSAAGGAIFAQTGAILLSNCLIIGNAAFAGYGDRDYNSPMQYNGQPGGQAQGGAIAGFQGDASIRNCAFVDNAAVGGTGGMGTKYGGRGGDALGGAACFLHPGSLEVVNTTMIENTAIGGAGGFANSTFGQPGTGPGSPGIGLADAFYVDGGNGVLQSIKIGCSCTNPLGTIVLTSTNVLLQDITVVTNGIISDGGPPVLTQPQVSGSNYSFSLQTFLGQTYHIAQATNLGGIWNVYTNFIGDGSKFSLTFPRTGISPGQLQFFRASEP